MVSAVKNTVLGKDQVSKPSTFLETGYLVTTTAYTRLAGLQALGPSISASICATATGFVCVLEIQTQILMLARPACCPLSPLPEPYFCCF